MKIKNISNIKWIGGKHGKEDLYIDLMLPHRIYADCTFGSGAVTFAKEDTFPASYMTVVNDKNDKLVNFMLQLRDHGAELKRLIEGLPFSESLYEKYKWEPDSDDPMERAVRFYYIMRLTFSGGGHKYRNGLGLSKTQNKATTYMHQVQLLEGMANRLKAWTILCRDMIDVVKFYDTKDSLFLLDPPYVGYENIYAGGFKPEDHKRVREALDTIKGKAMVCYYPDPLIDELYSDWYRIEYRKASQLETRGEGAKCPIRTELIFTNYRPPEYKNQISLFQEGNHV